MYATFVIPTLVSSSISEKLVPAITKLVERNVALSYKEVFNNALSYVLSVSEQEYIDDHSIIFSEGSYTFKSGHAVGTPGYNVQYIQAEIARLQNEIRDMLARMEVVKDDIRNGRRRSSDAGRDLKAIDDIIQQKHKQISELTKNLKIQQDLASKPFEDADNQEKLARERQKADLDLKKTMADMERAEREEQAKMAKIVSSRSDAPTRATTDTFEVPRGVSMYSTISYEPTYLEFQIKRGEQIMDIAIGFKCVPFTIEDPIDISALLERHQAMRGLMGAIKRAVISRWNRLRKKVWLSRARYIHRGRRPEDWVIFGSDPGDVPRQDIMFSPNYYELTDSRLLAKKLLTSETNVHTWAVLTVLSTEDFSLEANAANLMKDFRRLAKVGWGDIMVLDPNREVLNYCMLSSLNCFSLDFASISKLINLPNVIDYNDARRYTAAFKASSPQKVF